jgi:hypothetical protein
MKMDHWLPTSLAWTARIPITWQCGWIDADNFRKALPIVTDCLVCMNLARVEEID